MNLLEDVKRKVLAEGPFQGWKQGASNQALPDLRNLLEPSRAIFDFSKVLYRGLTEDNHATAARAAFAIMQNLYPIVEALDSDAGSYLAQAAEALRR